jgi:phosphate transport system permease protein
MSSTVMTRSAQRRRAVRKVVNVIALSLSGLATATGLFFLGAILWTLVTNGLAGMSGALFTESTPPPGGSGGLLNAIYGSVVMTLIGILIGAPIGMLATLRTTEDMLNLVPQGMKDASTAMGAYPWRTITSVIYPAARSGIVTGLLLAVARISGETAPLLFTALNNQFWSSNLNAPMANLPVVIFQFALSPYKNWQQLAWSGALLITVTILILSIVARFVVAALNPGAKR